MTFKRLFYRVLRGEPSAAIGVAQLGEGVSRERVVSVQTGSESWNGEESS
jgi:hypothetical protein